MRKQVTKPPNPEHVTGMHRGEEMVLEKGHEAGRGSGKYCRMSRDSTSINPELQSPIHPAMPYIPPS
jgi:hypothetical protein